MTPSQQQAARIEKDVEASALGRELMQPMPEGWFRTHHELRDGTWEVVAFRYDAQGEQWPAPLESIADSKASTLTEAHRLCREQAWAKHKKNTGGV